MKKTYITIVLVTMFMALPSVLFAQEGAQPYVDVAGICTGVANLEPIGTGISFPRSVGKLYCFTRVMDAQSPTQITHVWFYGLAERARVDLDVKASKWRTYSSKIIQSHETGPWHVNVVDSAGNVLKVVQFVVTEKKEPVPEAAPPQDPDGE